MHYKFSDKDIKIDEISNTLTNIRSASFKNNTCFIGNWINLSEETEAKRIKIRVNKLSSPSCFFIGIAPNDDNTNDSIDECTKYTYTYCGNGRIYFNNNEIKTVDDCEDGIILELILFESSLNMRLNDKEQILLFDDIIQTKYRFAISLCYAGDECVILEQNIAEIETEEVEMEQEEEQIDNDVDDDKEESVDENSDLIEKNEQNKEVEESMRTAMKTALEEAKKKDKEIAANQTASNQSKSCCVVL